MNFILKPLFFLQSFPFPHSTLQTSSNKYSSVIAFVLLMVRGDFQAGSYLKPLIH